MRFDKSNPIMTRNVLTFVTLEYIAYTLFYFSSYLNHYYQPKRGVLYKIHDMFIFLVKKDKLLLFV